MNLLQNIDKVLLLKKLHVIKEAGRRGRLRPAIITMKRGTTIEVDHARVIKHPHTRTPIVVFGIKSGIYPRLVSGDQAVGNQKGGLVSQMRDFASQGQYVPCEECGQDETGWADPDSTGFYDAHRNYAWTQRFQKIMTAYMENVANIDWIHETENKLRDEPDSHDYRGPKARQFAVKPVRWFWDNKVPEVILGRVLPQLVSGINVTIAARSQELGIEPVVILKSLIPRAQTIVATWISNNHPGQSIVPPELTFAEMPRFLEKESASHWKSS